MRQSSFLFNFPVAHRIFISVNGKVYHRQNSTIYYQHIDNHSLVRCQAVGAKPVVELTISVDGKSNESVTVDFTSKKNEENNNTFDSTLSSYIEISENEGRISCCSYGESSLSEKHLHLRYIYYG